MMSPQWLQEMVDNTDDGLLIAEYQGTSGPIVFANRAYRKISGLSEEELQGQCFRDVISAHHPEGLALIDHALTNQEECSVKIRSVNKRCAVYWSLVKICFIRSNEAGDISHVLFVVKDITQEEYLKNVLDKVNLLYREMCKRLEYSSETDPLTQLKNRNHLSTRGEFLLGAAKRQRMRMHAVMLDIDDFRQLNLLGGSSLGDDCLVQVATLINEHFCRTTDLAVRTCDDEFVIFCIEDEDQRIIERARALLQRIKSEPLRDFQKRPHVITATIGVYSVTPQKNTTVESLLQAAGALVFQQRSSRPGQVIHRSE